MRIIKKYDNRKLYDVVQGKYVTLQELAEGLLSNPRTVQVFSNKTGHDVTDTCVAAHKLQLTAALVSEVPSDDSLQVMKAAVKNAKKSAKLSRKKVLKISDAKKLPNILFAVQVPMDTVKNFKIQCAQDGVSMSAIVRALLDDYLKSAKAQKGAA